MRPLNGYNQYRDQQILTASPGDLILMLYDAGIRQIRLARAAIADQRPAEAGKALLKAQEIVDALIGGLDMGYPIAEQLLKLYDFINHELVAANMAKDAERARQAEDLLQELRATWEQVVQANRGMERLAQA